MRYGSLPKDLGVFKLDCREMMFYQYLPIKLPENTNIIYEDRLKCFDKLIGTACCDYIGVFGLDRYVNSYVYLTSRYLFVTPDKPFNREGWHSDGFLTDDINYIWCDKFPTIFNTSNFNLSQDDNVSLIEMDEQALPINNITYPENTLLRLDQFNIHKVAPVDRVTMRAFLKISISTDKYDLLGNSHNYLLPYNWEMKDRRIERNIPQSKIKL